jgi:hypothetical protein
MLKELFNKPIVAYNLKDVTKLFVLYQGASLLLSVYNERYVRHKIEED